MAIEHSMCRVFSFSTVHCSVQGGSRSGTTHQFVAVVLYLAFESVDEIRNP